jgi:polysaccharide biosynthesis/export protein
LETALKNISVKFSALLAAFSILLAGCAGNLPNAPSQASSPDYKYIIGPGDNLNIIVWRNPELSGNIPVRPDGRITTPLVEDMVALGKNPTQLAREIETALKKYIQDPVVTVVVQNFGSVTSEQVRVIGQAARPAALPYRQGMSLLDVMISVGGLTEFASGNRAVLIRASEGNKSYNLRLRDLMKRGDVTANVQLLPGDVIIVPESWF